MKSGSNVTQPRIFRGVSFCPEILFGTSTSDVCEPLVAGRAPHLADVMSCTDHLKKTSFLNLLLLLVMAFNDNGAALVQAKYVTFSLNWCYIELQLCLLVVDCSLANHLRVFSFFAISGKDF